ncbi:hypothetical protein U1Q18_003682 [Sarracenia purpurea var. burkii]
MDMVLATVSAYELGSIRVVIPLEKGWAPPSLLDLDAWASLQSKATTGLEVPAGRNAVGSCLGSAGNLLAGSLPPATTTRKRRRVPLEKLRRRISGKDSPRCPKTKS